MFKQRWCNYLNQVHEIHFWTFISLSNKTFLKNAVIALSKICGKETQRRESEPSSSVTGLSTERSSTARPDSAWTDRTKVTKQGFKWLPGCLPKAALVYLHGYKPCTSQTALIYSTFQQLPAAHSFLVPELCFLLLPATFLPLLPSVFLHPVPTTATCHTNKGMS